MSLTVKTAVVGAVGAAIGALCTIAPALAATPDAVAHPFSCSGSLGRYYTLQTVTGTLTGARPSNVSVADYTGTVQRTVARPTLDNAWWGGYWQTTYQTNQWKLGHDASARYYHLMLPQSRPGAAFTALLVTEFGAGGANGNWQNWMACTAG